MNNRIEWLCSHKTEYVISQGTCIDLKLRGITERFLIQLGTPKNLLSSSHPLPDEEHFFVVSPNQKLSIEFGEDIIKSSSASKANNDQ